VQISISTRHGHISDETQALITGKIEKLPRIFERLSRAEVIVDLERRDAPEVEVNLSVQHSEGFVAKTGGPNLLAAIDAAIHKLEQQLRKHKEKYITRRTNTGKRAEPAATPADVADTGEDILEESED